MTMDSSNFYPLSCQELASTLALQDVSGLCKKILLIDVRPTAQHCSKHITSSENINFSSILLRRLSKGVVELNSLLQYDQPLHSKLTMRNSEEECLVLYDSCSCKESIRTDLVRHGNILAKTKHERQSDSKIYFLDGGFEAFLAAYPQQCSTSSSSKKTHSPLGISVSASLPIFPVTSKPPSQKLCTPTDDSGNRFGPPVQILPHLVLGSAKDSSNLTQLRKMGVTAVLNVSHNCPNHFESVLEYKCIAVQDSYQADLLSKMESAIQFIDSVKGKGGCVFVHCHAGISRSATICISYIMKTMGWDLSQAYDFVKQKRPCISPNLHFMGQLLEFEKQLKEQRMLKGAGDASAAVKSATSEVNVQSPFPFHSGQRQPFTATSPFQAIPAPKHNITPVTEECDNFFCSNTSALPSASAPSSLNVEKVENTITSVVVQADMVVCSSKPVPCKPKTLPLFRLSESLTAADAMELVQCEDTNENEVRRQARPTPLKPTTLPLIQVKNPSKNTPTQGQAHRLLRQRSTPVQNSTSLPTTPDNHFKNHTFSSSSSSLSSSSSSVRVAPYSLQNSPCRVVARLGSGSESSLNYSYNGELSL